MKNLDAIINQLSNEQLRTEALLMKDVEKVKNACRLFFDKQAREADAFIALLSTTLDDIIARVRDGYPSHESEDEKIPSVVTGRPLTAEERSKILNTVGDTFDGKGKAREAA